MKRLIFIAILLLITSICFAANEIHYFDDAGQTNLYCRVVQASNLYLWDTGTSDYNDNPAWSVTDIALTENASVKGMYYASMPSSTAGYYYILVYAGSSPADTDTRLSGWRDSWDGSALARLDVIDTVVDAVKAKTDNLPSDPADDSDIDGQLATIAGYTDDIGTAGVGLTAIVWNADWDTEVQSEVDDALVANNLDHLMKTATGSADMTNEVVDNTALSRIIVNGDTSDFIPSTSSIQHIYSTIGENGGNLTYCASAVGLAAVNTTANTMAGYLVNGTYGLAALETLVDDLESRLTATRADYLDYINTIYGKLPSTTYIQGTSVAADDANDMWGDVIDIHDIVKSGGTGDPNEIWTLLVNGTYGLSAIRSRGDSAWITGSGGSAADTADAIWNEATSDHTSGGSFGKLLIDANSTIRRPNID